MTIKLAITGTGYIAKIHARAALAQEDVELMAVVNHRPESMATFASEFGIERQYSSVTDLLGGSGVDALVICTPNHLHAPQTIEALRKGLHVLVEKPMSMNASEAKAMVDASQASGSLLMVAHNLRFDPEVIWMRDQLTAGRLGEIVRTKGYGVHVNWGPKGWFTKKELAGGGAMADMGIHAIDTARFILGNPQPLSVYAQIGTYYQDYEVDDTGVVLVKWQDGAVSYIECGWWQPHADGKLGATQVYGTSGFGQIFPAYLKLLKNNGADVEKVDPSFPAVRDPHEPQSMYDDQMAHFIACIISNQMPKTSGVDGWINMKILDAAYESARTGRVIEL